ncbi:MAG: DMT family transporter [Firmicutes bacterium]|nr:DMT family transporter [Bacillota bacterium]
MTRTRLLGALDLSLAAAIWGGLYVVSKAVMSVIPPWVLLDMRLALGAAALGLILRVRGLRLPPLREQGALAGVGFLGLTLSVGLQFVGTALTTAATGALVTSASPAFIVLFAALWLGERLTAARLLALASATAGVAVIVWQPQARLSANVAGNLALIGAAVTWAAYTVLAKRASARWGALAVTSAASAWAFLFALPAALVEARARHFALPQEPAVWAGVLYIGLVSTALAFYLWNRGFERLDANTGALFFFLQPLCGALLGHVFLGEALGWRLVVGGALIFLGAWLAARAPESAQEPAA